MAGLGLCCCARLSLDAAIRGPSLAMRPGLLTAMAALVAERRLQGAPASVTAACGLGGFGSWALDHRPVVVAHGLVATRHVGPSWTRDCARVSCLMGGFITTEPAGRPTSHPLSQETADPSGQLEESLFTEVWPEPRKISRIYCSIKPRDAERLRNCAILCLRRGCKRGIDFPIFWVFA